LKGRWDALVRPRLDGLPNRVVLLGFPALLAALFVVLVATGITGSSTGVYWSVFHEGKDPSLIAGQPRPIRSDEWLVQSSWVVSQEKQHFPVINETLPGGMDATIQNDLPSWDWSTIFRPQVAGFLFMPIDQGMAVRWWLPALGMLVACYMFLVSLMPRRPVTSALITAGVYFTPLIQWWFLPTTIWPVAFAFFGMTAVIWAMRSRTRAPSIVFAALTGYVAIAMAMSIYVPFMIPAALVLVLFAVGVVLEHRSIGFKGIATRLLPLLIAGIAAGVVLVVWVLTRWSTVQAVFNTVYPGHRVQQTGKLDVAGLVSLFSGPFNGILRGGPDPALGMNQSEASSAVLWSVLLFVPMLWLVVRRWRAERKLNWAAIAVAVGTLLILAYLLIPGWDVLAKLLLLDRTTDPRVRLGFVVLGAAAIGLIVRDLDERYRRISWPFAAVSTVCAVGIVAGTALALDHESPATLRGVWWIVACVGIVLAVALLVTRRVALSSLALLLVAVAIGANVNPIYVGLFDVNTTKVGREVARVEGNSPGTWVGIGVPYPTAILVRSGFKAYNGVQTYPPKLMWHTIDPSGKYEQEWNRLANVSWVFGKGSPVVSSPVGDQVVVTFDSCSQFAQKNVKYVLANAAAKDQNCLAPISKVTQGPSTFWIYEVSRKVK
jgi:hypothetical protein